MKESIKHVFPEFVENKVSIKKSDKTDAFSIKEKKQQVKEKANKFIEKTMTSFKTSKLKY